MILHHNQNTQFGNISLVNSGGGTPLGVLLLSFTDADTDLAMLSCIAFSPVLPLLRESHWYIRDATPRSGAGLSTSG